MEEISIDRATTADREKLVDLYAADMRDRGIDHPRAKVQQVVDITLEDQGVRSHTWVARHKSGEIAGVLLAAPFWNFTFAGRGLWIEALYVSPKYRRRGIAGRMVEFLMDWAEAEGFTGLELEAYSMNPAASILYRSLGFRRLARERYCFQFGVDE